MIPQQENSRTEFKSSFSDAVIETLVAFANSQGGVVYVGVDDHGLPLKGLSIGKESVAKWLNEIKSKTQPSLIPDVHLKKKDGVEIVCFSVLEYPIKPVSCRGKYFKRVANSNHQMLLGEITDLHLKTVNLSRDFGIDPQHSVDDLSLDKVNAFIEAANQFRSEEQ